MHISRHESNDDASDALLRAIAAGEARAVLAAVRPAGTWPLSPAACLTAAVYFGHAGIVERLITEGAPVSYSFSDLEPAERVALHSAGAQPSHLQQAGSPLALSVRRRHRAVASVLLQTGAPAGELVNSKPLLLHLLEGLQAGGERDSPPRQQTPTTRGSTAHTPPSIAGSTTRIRALQGPTNIVPALKAAEELEEQLQLLWLLLRAGADPLQTSARPPHPCFLSGEPAAKCRTSVFCTSTLDACSR
jgi:hypothetical protein